MLVLHLAPSRYLALLPLLLGLVLTGFVATDRSAALEDDRAEARTQSADMLRAVSSDSENRLSAAGSEVIAAAQIVGRLVEENSDTDGGLSLLRNRLEEYLPALPLFATDREINAVVVIRGDRGVLVDRTRSELLNLVPAVERGLTAIDDSRWENDLAYGHDTDGDGLADIAFVLDHDFVVRELVAFEDEEITVRLRGLPGQDDPVVDTRDWADAGGGLWVDPDRGTGVVVSNTTYLGHPVLIEVVADSSILWVPSSIVPLVAIVVGALLSMLASASAIFGLKRLGRMAAERDLAVVGRKTAVDRFRSSFDHAPIGVVEVDEDGLLQAVNPRFASQIGYLSDELVGLPLLDLLDGEDRPAAAKELYRVLSGGAESGQGERRYRTRNGSAVWVRESISALSTEAGRRHVLVQAEDISDERRTRAELHRKALFDTLTGLPNRANLIAKLNRAIETERGPGELVAVLFVDLDKFKSVNDTHGHEAGDQLLIEVANRLRRASRSSDTVARLGGDEFIVVCEGLSDEASAEEAARRFGSVLRDPLFYQDQEIPVSASIGLVVSSEPSSADEILRHADKAMYEAKTSGRDRVVRFGSAMGRVDAEPRASAGEVTEPELREALDGNQFCLHYQPVRRVPEGGVVGFEALLRWEHPERGQLTPSAFLALAEELSLLPRIDAWVLKEGTEALGRLSATVDGAEDWFLVFNIATVNFNNRRFPEQVRGYVEAAGIDAHRVVLERNETWFMNQTPGAVLTTRELRAMGVRISLDHYGTASGAMGDLESLEFDFLKIDRSFVRHARERSTYVLEAMRNMGEALDLRVIVEGVETAAELRVVQKAGIQYAQGYHLGRPMSEEAVMDLHRSPATDGVLSGSSDESMSDG